MPLIDVLYFIINSEWMPPFKLYAHKNESVNQSTQRKQLARVPLLTNSFRETDSEE